MLDVELEVCAGCGTLHMEGGPGPRSVTECANCGGHVEEVEPGDLVGL